MSWKSQKVSTTQKSEFFKKFLTKKCCNMLQSILEDFEFVPMFEESQNHWLFEEQKIVYKDEILKNENLSKFDRKKWCNTLQTIYEDDEFVPMPTTLSHKPIFTSL